MKLLPPFKFQRDDGGWVIVPARSETPYAWLENHNEEPQASDSAQTLANDVEHILSVACDIEDKDAIDSNTADAPVTSNSVRPFLSASGAEVEESVSTIHDAESTSQTPSNDTGSDRSSNGTHLTVAADHPDEYPRTPMNSQADLFALVDDAFIPAGEIDLHEQGGGHVNDLDEEDWAPVYIAPARTLAERRRLKGEAKAKETERSRAAGQAGKEHRLVPGQEGQWGGHMMKLVPPGLARMIVDSRAARE